MIARSWSASVAAHQAKSFHRHLLRTGVSDYRRSSGCARTLVFRQDLDDRVRFTLFSFWTSREAMAGYGGLSSDAVAYEGDDAFDLLADDEVTVLELIGDYAGENE